MRASLYTIKNPNPWSTEHFPNQQRAVTIDNKDFGTILVSLFNPRRGISLPSSSS
jgi:hypothetical protein